MIKQQAANQHRKKGLSRIYIAQMSYRMRRNAKNNHFPSCKNPPYLHQLSLLAVLHVLPLSKYLQAQKNAKNSAKLQIVIYGKT